MGSSVNLDPRMDYAGHNLVFHRIALMHCPQVCSHGLSASGAGPYIQWSRKHQWSAVQFRAAEAPQLLRLICVSNWNKVTASVANC